MNPFVFKKINALLNTAKWDQEKLREYGIQEAESYSDDQIKAEVEKKMGHELQWQQQLVISGDGFAVHELCCIG